MMMLEKGKVYDGTIVEAWLEMDFNEKDGLVACFDIDSDSGAIRAKHKLFGDYKDRGREVVEHFGVKWPPGENELGEKAKGAECRFWVGEYEGKQYARINVPGSGSEDRRDPEAVKAALNRLAKDDVPF